MNWLARLGVAVLASYGAGFLGSLFITTDVGSWYDMLNKPFSNRRIGSSRLSGQCSTDSWRLRSPSFEQRPARRRGPRMGAALLCPPPIECGVDGILFRLPRGPRRAHHHHHFALLYILSHLRRMGDRPACRLSPYSLFSLGSLRDSTQPRDLVFELGGPVPLVVYSVTHGSRACIFIHAHRSNEMNMIYSFRFSLGPVVKWYNGAFALRKRVRFLRSTKTRRPALPGRLAL